MYSVVCECACVGFVGGILLKIIRLTALQFSELRNYCVYCRFYGLVNDWICLKSQWRLIFYYFWIICLEGPTISICDFLGIPQLAKKTNKLDQIRCHKMSKNRTLFNCQSKIFEKLKLTRVSFKKIYLSPLAIIWRNSLKIISTLLPIKVNNKLNKLLFETRKKISNIKFHGQ